MKPTSSVPTAAAPASTLLNVDDIQGVVLRGYSHHPYIRFFVLRIRDEDGARQFCRLLAGEGSPPLRATSAQNWKQPPPYCLNIGLTASGLKKLVGDTAYESIHQNTASMLFELFDVGAADLTTAARIGDRGESDPRNWWKNGNWKLPGAPTNENLDLLVGLYTSNAPDRETFSRTLLAMIPGAATGAPAVVAAFVQDSDPILDDQGKPTEKIHFDYVDGISQPRVKDTPWFRPNDPKDERPPVDASRFVISDAAPDYFTDASLLNGCFGAFRLLYQDVGRFRCFLAQSENPDLLAAKMCGRWQDGTPLILSPDQPNPALKGKALNNFTYLKEDPNGAVCPFASHIRRSNPRDDTQVTGNGTPSDQQQHRVMRRARPYGPPYTDKTADAQRGLVGLFLGASLTEQFQFIMERWIGSPGFHLPPDSPNQSGVDPLFGPILDDHAEEHDFEYQAGTPRPPRTDPSWNTAKGLSRFVRTDGALYVFIPSLTALKAFGQPPAPPAK